MNVKHIRLVNGNELIGEVLFEDEDFVLIDGPLLVNEMESDLGSALMLNPYIPYSQNTCCQIKTDHIVTVTDLHPVMIKHYTLSLKATNRLNQKILDEIDRVNQTMEALMMEESIDPTRISKGTDSVH